VEILTFLKKENPLPRKVAHIRTLCAITTQRCEAKASISCYLSLMKKMTGNIIIFLASNFEEELVSQCVVQMRGKGLGFQIVGIENKPLHSYHGLLVYPDLSVENLFTESIPELILIPGEKACASLLMSDPRVFFYLENVLRQNGRIAISKKAGEIFAGAGLQEARNLDRFVHQEDKSTYDFVADLISRITKPVLWKPAAIKHERLVVSVYG
jgi:hypothetical protein